MKTRSLYTWSIIAGCLLVLPAMAGLSFIAAQAALPASSKYEVPHVNPGDWPMYGHDVSRTNFNPDETIINAGNVSQLVSRWQMFIGTNNNDPSGAPSVADGKVFVGSSRSGNNFFAFDAVTGAQAWNVSVGYQNSCFNVGIGSTSAISGTIVSVGGGDAAYYGLDTNTGNQIWRNPMNVGNSAFPWESPLLANGLSYLGMSSRCDNPSVRGEVRAVNLNSGSTVNSQYFVPAGQVGGGIWNSPALSPDGSTLVVATGEDYNGNGPYTRAMVSLDPITLAILQYHQEGATGQDLDFGTTPVIFHDSQNRTLVAAGHKNDTFYTYLLNNITGGALWTKNSGTQVGMMPAYDPTFGSGGTLFIAGSNQLYAVDPATGTNRWSPVSIGGLHGNMAIANGLIFTNENGRVDIRLESNGSLLTTLVPSNAGGNNSGPVVSDGFVYFLSGSYINAWSLPANSTPTTNTPTRTPTRTATSTRTTTPTNTTTTAPTQTPGGPTATPVPSNTATSTSTRTSTATSSSTRTSTPTLLPTQTPGGPTATPVPSNTPISTPTVISSTSTPTNTTTTAPTQTPGGPTATPVPSNIATSTSTRTPTGTSTSTRTSTPTLLPTQTPGGPTATTGPSNTPTPCALQFTDVPPGSTFYSFVHCLSCLGIVSGYDTGCSSGNPCFRPGNNVTRGQLAKIASNAAGFQDPPGDQIFEDVVPGSTFYDYVQRLASRGYIGGYSCGGPGEPCVPPGNRPYYRPNTPLTRGQISKIVSNSAGFQDPPASQQFDDVLVGSTFYTYTYRLASRGVMQGYSCGGTGEPCVPPDNLPYFRPNNNATRGQTSKIVANSFFPDCNPPSRRSGR